MGTKKLVKNDAIKGVKNWLKKNERSLRWLSIKADIPYGTMYKIFTQKQLKLSDDNRAKINTAIGTDF